MTGASGAYEPPSRSSVSIQVQANWRWFLALGIVFILGGLAAIAMPFIASVAVTVFVAAAMMIIGVLQVIQAIRLQTWSGYLFQLVVGVLILLGGVAIYFEPVVGTLALTVLVAAVFIAKGIFQIVLAFRIRPHDAWAWLVIAGLISLLVGVMIYAQFPVSGVYALGILAGVSLIFTGVSYLALALAAQRRAGLTPSPR